MRTSIIMLSLLSAIALFGCPGAVTPPVDGGTEQAPDTGPKDDPPIQATCGVDKDGVQSYCDPGYICCSKEDGNLCKAGSLWQCRKITWVPVVGIDCKRDRLKRCLYFVCGEGDGPDYAQCAGTTCPDGAIAERCIKPRCLSDYDCKKPARCRFGLCQ